MGGDLTAASAPGAGSTLTLTLRRVITAAGELTDRRTGDERRFEKERRVEDWRHESAASAAGVPEGADAPATAAADGALAPGTSAVPPGASA